MAPRDGDASTDTGFGSLADPNIVLSVVVGEDGKVELAAPAIKKTPDDAPANFGENLAERFEGTALAYDLLEGIESDLSSRQQLTQQYADGLKLLGLTVENDSGSGNRKGRSRVGHPLLLAAVVDGQSGASGELLPSTGPCKIETRDGDTEAEDELAESLARDMNWYLTTGAPEYYPDMDRGLFGLFYSGNLFRAVYEHPIRRRPVGESIATDDLIVSEDATNLDTAQRVTQRNEMTQAEVARMKWAGVWKKDVELGQGVPSQDQSQQAKSRIEGIQPISLRPKDQPHTIYQCTTDVILGDYGWDDPRAPGDLPVSYRVTLDKDSRQVTAVNRAWRFGDEQFQRRQRYVHYGMVPGFGFLCLGYLHLLGNQTKALRAIWRLLIDAGMFSNFPGGIKAKSIRLGTNEIDPSPGEWKDVDISGFDDISKAFMPMPYKGPDAVFIQLAELIGKESAMVAGAAKAPVGDSRVDIPVGTMLALIEQATKVDSAVHKRLHRAQARELELFKELFAENPEALTKLNPDPAYRWQTREEIMNQKLVPASDPNVPSQIHRIMLNTAMVTVAGQNPDIYNRKAVHERAWRSMGIRDTDSFLHDPDPAAQPGADPAKMAKVQVDQQKLALEAQGDQRKAATEMVDTQQRARSDAADVAARAADVASKERIAQMREETERQRMSIEEARAQRQMQHDATAAGRDHAIEAQRTLLEHERHGAEMDQQAEQHGAEMKVKNKVANKPVAKKAASK